MSGSTTKFARLATIIGSPEFQKVMGRVRNNLTFHYDFNTLERVLQLLVSKHPEARGAMSLGY